MIDTIRQQLKALPAQPGVYIFKDAAGKILYVGKAKVLRHRTRSYFQNGAKLDPAKEQMVKETARIKTIAVDNETEALVLEANLIQQHQPPYNVILRDDKYFLFIKITNEMVPRVFLTRRLKSDGARYFGPYSSAHVVRATLKLLRRLFPFHGEKDTPRDKIFPHPLFADTAKNVPRRALPKPLAKEGSLARPVAKLFGGEGGLHIENDQNNISNIIRFLKGEREEVIATLRRGMQQAAAERQYERAAIFRDQLQAIEKLVANQKVYLPRQESFDIISIASKKSISAANVFSVRRGKLLGKNTFLLRHRGTTLPEDIVRQFILQYYRVAQNIPKKILIPHPLTDERALQTWINRSQPPAFHTPQRGIKHQLLKLGTQNAEHLLAEQEASFTQDTRLQAATADLAQAVGLPRQQLSRIETYDVSNIQGHLATASMVVFLNGKPQPRLYRKFRLRLTGQPNDIAMIQEVLRRRFSQNHTSLSSIKPSSATNNDTGTHRKTSWPQPDLVLVDGGKPQLAAAIAALDSCGVAIPVATLAKREEELFVPGTSQPIRLPYDSDTLYLLQRMRDEAHRFTLTYHRLLRSKRQQHSLLDEIPGIGPKTKRQLISHFGSLKAVQAARPKQLADVIGPAKAKTLQEYL